MPIILDASDAAENAACGSRFRPNRALLRAAGPCADRVAKIFPRPHREYFEADSARRRLIHLTLWFGRDWPGREALPKALAEWSLKRLIDAFLPNALAGLAEALKRCDEAVWDCAEHKALMDLLACPFGQKVLRHAPRIDADLLGRMARLPVELRRAKILLHVPTRDLCGHAAEWSNRALLAEEGRLSLRALGDRLERACSTTALFMMLVEACGQKAFPEPPVREADWLKAIRGVKDMERAALRFQNCLRHRIPLAVEGRGFYFEVVGPETAIVEIIRVGPGFEWRFGEIAGHANAPISQELRGRICAHFGGAVRK